MIIEVTAATRADITASCIRFLHDNTITRDVGDSGSAMAGVNALLAASDST